MVNEEGYGPQGLEYRLKHKLNFEDSEVRQLRELEHKPQEQCELEYELGCNNMDTHHRIYEPWTLKSRGVRQHAEPKYKGLGQHTHTHHYPTPTPRNIPGTIHSVTTPTCS
jgi:hypothetical protein